MSEPDSKIVPVITDVVLGLPEPVQASFWKAIGNFLGGLSAIPAAKLKQYAQAIEDTTVNRSMVGAIVAKAVGEEATKDPVLMQAAAEAYLPTALRKAQNRRSVAESAAEHLAEKVSSGASTEETAPPDDDWMNSFMRFAEDASSERLQDLFGRILAGQVLRPGAFGFSTLRTLSELDQDIAIDFIDAWSKSVGDRVDYAKEWRLGDYFERWKRLSEAGLMAPSTTAQYPPPYNPDPEGNSPWTMMSAGGTLVHLSFEKGCNLSWEHINFTKVGREIGCLLPIPNYEANMRKAAQRLPRASLASIELRSPGKKTEVIWEAAAV